MRRQSKRWTRPYTSRQRHELHHRSPSGRISLQSCRSPTCSTAGIPSMRRKKPRAIICNNHSEEKGNLYFRCGLSLHGTVFSCYRHRHIKRCPIMRKNRTSRARRGDPMSDNQKESDIPGTIPKKEGSISSRDRAFLFTLSSSNVHLFQNCRQRQGNGDSDCVLDEVAGNRSERCDGIAVQDPFT